ncbi:MAG: TolC family protein [Acidobacteriota bacterium]
MKALAVFFLSVSAVYAEVHVLTLEQALARALDQNPDVMLTRLDQQKARNQVTIAGDPFSPKLGIGTGLAYTNGMPTTIDGNAPSIFQMRANMSLFNQPQKYKIAQANEGVRGATLDITLRQEDVAYRVTAAFLDAENAAHSAAATRLQTTSLEEVQRLIETRLAAGQELPLALTRARVNSRHARSDYEEFSSLQTTSELQLAQLLGYPGGDQVRPAMEAREPQAMPASEEEAVTRVIEQSTELRRLRSNLNATLLEMKSYKAERLPKLNLVFQEMVLTKFNNYDTYFPRFQRNNFQIGASIEVPIFMGHAAKAYVSQAQMDADKTRIEIQRTQSRITVDVRQAYADLARAESKRELSNDELELTREELSVLLKQQVEGRATMAQIEAARAAEQVQWIAYYAAQRTLELARLNVRKNTGTLLASSR